MHNWRKATCDQANDCITKQELFYTRVGGNIWFKSSNSLAKRVKIMTSTSHKVLPTTAKLFSEKQYKIKQTQKTQLAYTLIASCFSASMYALL